MTGSWKEVPQARNAEEETISLVTVTTRNFSSEIMIPSCQSITEVKLVKLNYQVGKHIRIIAVKIFIETARGSQDKAVGK